MQAQDRFATDSPRTLLLLLAAVAVIVVAMMGGYALRMAIGSSGAVQHPSTAAQPAAAQSYEPASCVWAGGHKGC